ncbi:DUF72 domain-containing protein [Sphingobacterium phlebotomi]|uniref:DUF72 domain-containing protein n=1 Tax=Sphingobacterium phlebotomi TaxID=2605433 RepID=A0A5D4HFV4_9SPHI|nr:DUF72 domain-containing protein [Sphingobacterium phlebotomi]
MAKPSHDSIIVSSQFVTATWKTLFYLSHLRKNWFEYYSKCFNTYGFNGTFYKFSTVENSFSWHHKVAGDFKFSFKAQKKQSCTLKE